MQMKLHFQDLINRNEFVMFLDTLHTESHFSGKL